MVSSQSEEESLVVKVDSLYCLNLQYQYFQYSSSMNVSRKVTRFKSKVDVPSKAERCPNGKQVTTRSVSR